MEAPVSGHPLHTRSLTLHMTQRGDGRVRAFGNVIDLRKSGCVPMMGDLQPAGIVHHMVIDAVVDPQTRVLDSLDTSQPVVAVEAAPATLGESCRDSAPRLQGLVGRALDDAFAEELSATYAGPRGCSHLYTLFQMMATAIPVALEFDAAERASSRAQRRAEETIFRRSILLDGLEQPGGVLQMLVQLGDFANRPDTQVEVPADRLAFRHELRALLSHSTRTLEILRTSAAERRRTPESLADTAWTDRSEEVQFLVGRPIMPGLGGQLRRTLGSREDAHHLLQAFLQFAPGFVQCTAALSDAFYESGSAGERGGTKHAVNMGGGADSCHMWRTDGPLLQIRNRQHQES